jgi:methionyl-tRNA formyltransferase
LAPTPFINPSAAQPEDSPKQDPAKRAHSSVVVRNPWRTVFMGSGEIGLPTLRWLTDRVHLVGVVTQPDKPVGRSQTVTPSLIKSLATHLPIPILQPEKIRRPEALDAIAALNPDLIVVMAYGQILPKALLDMPRIACLNLHASLLPKHRGAAPIQAAICAGDTETGLTAMYMDMGLDTGDMLCTVSIPIARRDTGGTLHDKLAKLGPGTLENALTALAAGNAPRIQQDAAQATYAQKLDRTSGYIDWSKNCTDLDRLIRAMNPWPGASTEINIRTTVRRLKIHRALPLHRINNTPGKIVQLTSRGMVVACGTGGLLLREVQLEGKKRVDGADFLHGSHLQLGSLIG